MTASPPTFLGRPARLDRAAFEDLYLRQWGPVVNFFRFRIGALEAEDAAADLFSRLWSQRASFDPQRAPAEHWMWAAARNAAIDALRRGGAAQAPAQSPILDDTLEDRTARRIDLLARLQELGAKDHEILALRFGAGLSHPDIASLLGMRSGTVAVRIHRSLHRLRKMEGASGDSP
jgi:RNA polymerase sigma-70 factor (ECF subfamily)